MIRYEVRLAVDPALAESVEEYMVTRHIPAIMALGCFERAYFDRAEGGAFRTTYVATNRDAFDRYLQDHAEGLRADFQEHFPVGVTASRELWTQLREWGLG